MENYETESLIESETLTEKTSVQSESIYENVTRAIKPFTLNRSEGNVGLLSELTITEKSFGDILYNEINQVIGGSSADQYFSLSIPGTILEPLKYAYNVKKNEPKPQLVIANESKLVNRLFDASYLVAADNGRQLSTQYRTAINALTPILNTFLYETKNELRKLLLTPFPYRFDGDKEYSLLTLEQVFYKLYHEYVDAKNKWAKLQIATKKDIRATYPENTEDNFKKRENEYLDWYATVADSEILVVEEKLGKILSVFSPGDMDIINGILDSGVGREIAEARSLLANAQTRHPDGGYVYPVSLNPPNWFDLLDTTFTPIDLLEGQPALAKKLLNLQIQRSNIFSRIQTIINQIPTSEEIEKLKQAKAASDAAYDAAYTKLDKTYTEITKEILKMIVDIAVKEENVPNIEADTVNRLNIKPTTKEQISKFIDAGFKGLSECFKAQDELLIASKNAAEASLNYLSANNIKQLEKMLAPLNQQLTILDLQINDVQAKISIVSVLIPDSTKGTDDVLPNETSDHFTNFTISTTLSSVINNDSDYSTESTKNYGVSFFFGGYSKNSTHSEVVKEIHDSNTNVTIDIGMSIAKVSIERDWFNPGVFLLTPDLFNSSKKQISPKKSYEKFDKERFKDMNSSIFSTFPTAFVVAKDVSIQFTLTSEKADLFAQAIEDHTASAGGIFCFKGSSSSTTKSSKLNSDIKNTSTTITVRFTSPQIIGYYNQATPVDESTYIGNQTGAKADTLSILEFVSKFQEILTHNNTTYHSATLNLNSNKPD